MCGILGQTLQPLHLFLLFCLSHCLWKRAITYCKRRTPSTEAKREEKRVREKERQELKQQLDDRNNLTAFLCIKEKKKNGSHWSICFFLSFCFLLLSHRGAGRHIIFSFIRSLHHLPPDLLLHLYGV